MFALLNKGSRHSEAVQARGREDECLTGGVIIRLERDISADVDQLVTSLGRYIDICLTI